MPALRERRIGRLLVPEEFWFASGFLAQLFARCVPLQVEHDLANASFRVTAASEEFFVSPKCSTIHPAYGLRVAHGPGGSHSFTLIGFVDGWHSEIVPLNDPVPA